MVPGHTSLTFQGRNSFYRTICFCVSSSLFASVLITLFHGSQNSNCPSLLLPCIHIFFGSDIKRTECYISDRIDSRINGFRHKVSTILLVNQGWIQNSLSELGEFVYAEYSPFPIHYQISKAILLSSRLWKYGLKGSC